MSRSHLKILLATVLASILLTGCTSASDYFGDGMIEAEIFDSVATMARASDLVVAATVSDVVVSDYTEEWGIEIQHFAEIVLDVSRTFGQRKSFGAPVDDRVSFLTYLGAEDIDHTLEHLREALPGGETRWFLRSVETDDREFYILVNSAGAVTPSQDGSYMTAAFYQRSSELAHAGRLEEVESHRALLAEITKMRPADVDSNLKDAAQGPRDLGHVVPPESRP